MAIYRLLQESTISRDDIRPILSAYEDALRILSLRDRANPVTEVIAKKIIAVAQSGVRDPAQICRLALMQWEIPPAAK